MKPILAIDPGTEKSAWVIWNPEEPRILDMDIQENRHFLSEVSRHGLDGDAGMLAIEMVASYGMAVGKTVFETVFWIGRLCQRWSDETRLPWRRVYRSQIKMHHCGNSRAKDSNIRQALIDKYGPPGVKKAKGLTYGLKADLWQAFAVATYLSESVYGIPPNTGEGPEADPFEEMEKERDATDPLLEMNNSLSASQRAT